MKSLTPSTGYLAIFRRGVALAALGVFVAAATATWLASDPAHASAALAGPGQGNPGLNAAVFDTDRPDGDTSVQTVDRHSSDARLTKGGKVLSGKLNINTATEDQLRMLPGIGPAKARRVIAYRDKRGKFKRVRDLRRVKGFGYKTVTKLSPYLTVKGESTLKAE